MSTITVLVPTLNEEENVDLLLERIFAVRESCQLDFDILFIDSASADGTCDRVISWQEREPVCLLRHSKRTSLAGAVMAGARYATSRYVLVMDADLSHPPERIPDLIRPLQAGTHDMVIGSRYVEGSALPDWPITRKISSKIATYPAKLFCDVADPLSGFFAVKRSKLVGLPETVPGFKIGLALLAEYRNALRVIEIPIEFRDRDFGKSKMNYRVALDYFKQLLSLALKRAGTHDQNTQKENK